jgi:hypothetical protein
MHKYKRYLHRIDASAKGPARDEDCHKHATDLQQGEGRRSNMEALQDAEHEAPAPAGTQRHPAANDVSQSFQHIIEMQRTLSNLKRQGRMTSEVSWFVAHSDA